MFKKHTQVDDIIETMQKNGGYATLAYLNQNVDTSRNSSEKFSNQRK